MTVKILPNDKGNPPGKLADAELHFTDGPLEGLKLIGFAIWERRGGGGGRNVTFPARQYSVNGERRSFALLRPIVDATAQNRIRDLVLEAFQEYEERAAVAAAGTSRSRPASTASTASGAASRFFGRLSIPRRRTASAISCSRRFRSTRSGRRSRASTSTRS